MFNGWQPSWGRHWNFLCRLNVNDYISGEKAVLVKNKSTKKTVHSNVWHSLAICVRIEICAILVLGPFIQEPRIRLDHNHKASEEIFL